ncbi:MAG: hypothetical protein AB7I38_17035 [Dehalococcoidia bacterium]
MFALKWVGQEGQFVAGFPAQDIKVEDADVAGFLVFGRCYTSDDEVVNAIAREIALTEPTPGDENVLPRNLEVLEEPEAA